MISRLLLTAMMLQILPASAMDAGVHYACQDRTQLTASFRNAKDGPGSVDLVFQGSDERMSLPQALSADGGRYADGKTEFWIKGTDATLTRAGKATTCKIDAK